MNTKRNKNKNRPNKTHNPNPPQKVEEVVPAKKEEEVKQITETVASAPKIEERVPEIISDVLQQTVLDGEGKNDEIPKKPKRNRGKKKNQDSDTHVDTQIINAESDVLPEVLLDTYVAPSVPKKKNKAKKSTEPTPDVSEKTEEKDTALREEAKITEIVEVKEQMTISTIENPSEQEGKSSKKKNKKKKHRTDSEKSEKAEELSCIAAFQKLLKDEKSDVTKEDKIEDIVSTAFVPQRQRDSEKNICSKKDMTNKKKDFGVEDSKLEEVNDLSKQPLSECSQGKKKNKKDKKNVHKEEKLVNEVSDMKVKATTEINLEPTPLQLDTLDIKKDIMITENLPQTDIFETIIPMEDSCEAKPKIARPVERKRKGKESNKTNNILPDTTVKDCDTVMVEEKLRETSAQIQEHQKQIKKEEQDCQMQSQEALKVSTDKHLTDISTVITPVFQMGKNRKNSPKPKVHQVTDSDTTVKDCDTVMVEEKLRETSTQIQEHEKQIKIEVQDYQIQSQEALKVSTDKHLTDISTVITPDFQMGKKRKNSPKPKVHQVTDSNPTQGSESNQNVETLMGIVISEMEEIPKEKKSVEDKEAVVKTELSEEDVKKTEKSKKKTKKFPKFPVEKDIDTKEQVPGEESNKEKHTKEEKEIPNINRTEKTPTSLEDIEIRSLRADESEGSDICGLTPDIHYPRATSQDFTDDNNNMSILEIAFVEETKLRIPVVIPDTPLICGSGETPIKTPEITVATNKNKDEKNKMDQSTDAEKTDLKSKMMEVNQDMEELRLSIEKSLAEFTTLEKNEDEVEKEFANKKLIFTEKALPTNVKQEMPSEMIAKTKSEKEKMSSQEITESKESTSSANKTPIIEESFITATVHSEEKGDEVKNITEGIALAVTKSVDSPKLLEKVEESVPPPESIAKKDHKNKGKSKKKGKQDSVGSSSVQSETLTTSIARSSSEHEKTAKTEQKPEKKTDNSGKQGKQQSELSTGDNNISQCEQELDQDITEFDPIENFEDAMTSSADDINKSFEMIANDANQLEASHVNPEINITAPVEDERQEVKDEKIKPVTQPKNLLGHPDIPVRSSKIDYKKEKNKSPNETLAKVKIKDSIAVEAKRESKESQTDNIRKFMKNKSIDESISLADDNEDFVYKYNFRKVFLQSTCHVCKKDLKQSRVACSYCSLVFYCSGKHKDEDWPQHQALCFAVSTIGHLKDQKHIYADAKNVTGQNYRLLRMQMIVSCEKVLKRRLLPWEQEALLYPRICAEVSCREWRQSKLVDCDGCNQISYCSAQPDHLPKSHQRWCKSYSLYQKLVSHQQTKGRLEPKLPSKVLMDFQMPEKINEVLASMYEEKIDMSDIQYAALTQMATAPLTAAYCYQIATRTYQLTNGLHKKSTCTIHVVDAELQFEADSLNKWEIFFLHLVPVDELRVVMVSTNLNPGDLPLELLSKIKLCETCRVHKRRLVFSFHDKQSYYEYWAGEDFVMPNIVCAFNANIDRSSTYNVKPDPWPKTINCILKQRVPFLITAHTVNELNKDLARIQEYAEQKFKVIIEPRINSFASVRPDRNFITDDEIPLLFKNYCYTLLIGVQ
ncbi:hypothetical protein evm_000806 [Chilo suppressalis]|nr:hypothetical protein evm_000806 [Chilo suppressalis]